MPVQMTPQYALDGRGRTRFFCEGCNHEVPFNAEICPHCRKTFSAVKCPNCGFSGKANLFGSGCPHCGHFANRTRVGRRAQGVEGLGRGSKKRKASDVLLPLLVVGGLLLAVYVFWLWMNR